MILHGADVGDIQVNDLGDIGHSLRLRASASANLSKASFNISATATYFAAVKRGKLGAISPIFDSLIKFNANDTLTAFGLTTTAVFRDPTSWIFIVVGNGELRVNGVNYGAVTTSAITGLRIGYDGTNCFDGYIARIGVVDVQSVSYTSFGYQNSDINEWVTKSQSVVKAVVDAGGSNSFMLDFDNGTSLTTLGYDKSAKGNNWTLNNVSLTAGASYDWMLDVPSNSYAVFNTLDKGSNVTVQDGNIVATFPASGIPSIRGTIGITSGKWYWEVLCQSGNNNDLTGITTSAASLATYPGGDAYGWSYYSTGQKYTNGSGSSYGASYTNNDLIGVAFDADVGTLVFYKNGTGQGIAFTGLTNGPYFPSHGDGSGSAGTQVAYNFGQRPFYYGIPNGFKSLCQANLADNETITTGGTFTGNLNADGPYIDLKGTPTAMTINGNAVTFGTHADKTAFGFKLRTASSSYNNTGSNTYSITSTGPKRKYALAKANP